MINKRKRTKQKQKSWFRAYISALEKYLLEDPGIKPDEALHRFKSEFVKEDGTFPEDIPNEKAIKSKLSQLTKENTGGVQNNNESGTHRRNRKRTAWSQAYTSILEKFLLEDSRMKPAIALRRFKSEFVNDNGTFPEDIPDDQAVKTKFSNMKQKLG